MATDTSEGLRRGTFRVMGITKTTLMLGIYAAATNLRLLRSWQGHTQSAATAGSSPANDLESTTKATHQQPSRGRPPNSRTV
jgi:hypothetical protein